jgi:hypothetical protein
MIKDAIISECSSYRYMLSRKWSENNKTILFCMINPSLADDTIDDRTIKRCIGFAQRWEYDQLMVINLYALITPYPHELWLDIDPVGIENDAYIQKLASENIDIVCGWGADAKKDRAIQVATVLKNSGGNLMCLGLNKNGSPKHPLYVKSDKPLIPWDISMLK